MCGVLFGVRWGICSGMSAAVNSGTGRQHPKSAPNRLPSDDSARFSASGSARLVCAATALDLLIRQVLRLKG